MEKTIVLLHTMRSHYRALDAAEFTLTVGDLIRVLERFDEDTPVVFSNDNGYTYGRVLDELIEEKLMDENE